MLNETYALISDIHGNLPALEAVLADILRGTPAGIYHLGDLVGYAPWPNETVAFLKAASVAGVAGNYDSTVASDYKRLQALRMQSRKPAAGRARACEL